MPDAPKIPITIPPTLGPFIPYLQALGVGVLGAFVSAALDSAFDALLAYVLGTAHQPWSMLWRTSTGAGVVSAVAYLKHSPLGRKIWSDEQREVERVKLEEQGRLPR